MRKRRATTVIREVVFVVGGAGEWAFLEVGVYKVSIQEDVLGGNKRI